MLVKCQERSSNKRNQSSEQCGMEQWSGSVRLMKQENITIPISQTFKEINLRSWPFYSAGTDKQLINNIFFFFPITKLQHRSTLVLMPMFLPEACLQWLFSLTQSDSVADQKQLVFFSNHHLQQIIHSFKSQHQAKAISGTCFTSRTQGMTF